jgi:CRP-like cAMP-binding protein
MLLLVRALHQRTLLEELAVHPLFGGLDRALHRDLIAASAVHYLDPGELLYVAGELAEHVFAVLEGALQIEYPKRGRTRGYAAAVLSAPCLLGECQALHQLAWSGTGVVIAPMSALVIPARALERLILAHPAFGLVLYQELARRFLSAIETWKRQLEATPDETLARYLSGYIQALRGAGVGIGDSLRIRQADLGRATGLRRETINRLLKAWSKEGLLRVEARGLSAIDLDRIQAILSERRVPPLDESIDPGQASLARPRE